MKLKNNKKSLKIVLISIFTVILMKACQYTPPVNGIDSVETIHLTQPSLLKGYYLNVLNILDEPPPCRYEILGWEQPAILYYEETCYEVALGGGYAPRELDNREIISQKTQAFDFEGSSFSEVNIGGQSFLSNEIDLDDFIEEKPNNSLRINLKSPGYLSHDQTYVALVAQHIYGPEDVLVLKLPSDFKESRE